MKLYTSAKSTVLADEDLSTESFVSMIHKKDTVQIAGLLSKCQGRNIPIFREFLLDVFKSESLGEKDFWFLVETLLDYDRRIFRKPITDATLANDVFSSYKCQEYQFDKIMRIMLEDPDKVQDGLRFLSVFKSSIRDPHRQILLDSAKHITNPEGFSILYDLLGLNIEERIEMACNIASIPALYSLYMELAAAEEKYGIWHVQGIPNFPDRLNDLPDNYEVQLIFDLIEKNVLHEDIEDSSGDLAEIERCGYDAFFRMTYRHNAKVAYRKKIKTIGTYTGKTVNCRIVSKYERHFLVHTTGEFGLSGLLPISLVNRYVSIADTIPCKVVSVIKDQKLLLLSQKPCKKSYVESIPVMTVGEIYEAKFSLYNDKVVPEIMGRGPVRATLKYIPKYFDYKKHHKVRVISARLATCEIEIID